MRKGTALALLCVMVLATHFMLWRQQSTVTVTGERLAANPIVRYAATGEPEGVVIVAHGFAASKEMMRSWGYAMARQGFDTYILDQPGHGRSDRPLLAWGGVGEENALGANLRAVIDELVQSGRAQPGSIAVVGHSMGGSTVTAAALGDPRIGATVSLSSAYRGALPPDRPANLLSFAAQRDLAFMVQAVAELAAQSADGQGVLGQQYGDFAQGTARMGDLVEGRNHITIIFDSRVIEQSAQWIHASFGSQFRQVQTEQSWAWVLGGLVSALGAVVMVGSMLAPPVGKHSVPTQSRLGPLTGTVTLSVAALFAVMASIYLRFPWIGLAVADYIVPYFLVMAAVLLALRSLWPREFDFGVFAPGVSIGGGIWRGVGLFIVYLGAVGPVIHLNLSNYIPTPERLWPMAIVAAGLWLYFVQEEALKRAIAGARGVWIGPTIGLVGKLVVAATWLGSTALPNPQPFLPLTIPVVLVMLLLMEFFSFVMAQWRYPVVATATFIALVLAWTIAVTFPMV